MKRGLNQVIRQFMPGQIFDNVQAGLLCRSVEISRAMEMDDINLSPILNQIKIRFSKFNSLYSDPQFMKMDKEQSKFVLLEPIKVKSEIFPLSFTCEKCGSFYSFSSKNQVLSSRLKCTRNKCNGSLTQFTFVIYHNCGFISNVYQMKAKNCEHSISEYKLNFRGSSEPRNWYWSCPKCQARREFYYNCNICKQQGHKNHLAKLSPLRKYDVYIPQTFNIVQIKEVYNRKANQNILLAQAFGILNQKIVQNAMNISKESLSELKRQNEIIDSMRKAKLSEETINEIISNISNVEGVKEREAAIKESSYLETLFNNYKELNEESIRRIIEYVFLKHTTPEDIIQESKYNKMLKDSLRISDIRYTSNLSLLLINFGYSREFENALVIDIPSENSKLRERRKNTALRGYDKKTCDISFNTNRYPIYGAKYKTEAILIEFDISSILDYLYYENFDINIPKSVIDQRYYYSKLLEGKIPIFNEISEEEFPLLKRVYTILHSFSHLFIKAASLYCGLGKNSLGELIYPEMGTIVIYDSQRQETRIGALKSLLSDSRNFTKWLEKTIEYSETCMNDPLCINRAEDEISIGASTGACYACLYLSESNCIHFNKDLDRRLIIGVKNKFSSFLR